MLDDAQEGLARLQAAVGSGMLRIEPGAAERVAQHLDVLAESVKIEAVEMARAVVTHNGFGTFDSGMQLQSGFEDKLVAAMKQLDAYAAVVANMSTAVRAVGASYSERDATIQGAIDGIGAGLC